MANENVVIRRGPSAQIPETKTPGQILIATDTGEMYVDDTADSRVAIGGKDPTKLPLEGGTLTGPLMLPANQNTNSNAAVRYKWVMDQLNSLSTDISEQISGIQTTVGNAATKSELAGKVDKTVTVNGQALSGNVNITTVTGNAGTATKLATARTISLTGDVTGSATFDGSQNISIACTAAGGGNVDMDDGAIS